MRPVALAPPPTRHEHRNQLIEFPLPGREVYALRLEQISSSINPELLPDLAIGVEDVVLAPDTDTIALTVHNIGSAQSLPVSVRLVELGEQGEVLIGESQLPAIAAPLELVDQSFTLNFPATGLDAGSRVRVQIDTNGELNELCETNNILVSGLDGVIKSIPYPYASHASRVKVRTGRTFEVYGTNLSTIVAVELGGAENEHFEILSVAPDTLKVRVSKQAPLGQHFLSLVSSAGQRSNLFAMTIVAGPKLSAKRTGPKQSIDMGYIRRLAGCSAAPLSLWICLPLLGLLRRRKKALKPGM